MKPSAATRLESAIARVIAEGKVRTYDMGGKAPRSMWPKPSPITPVHKSVRGTHITSRMVPTSDLSRL